MLSNELKEDLASAQQRLAAWWQGQVLDRVCIQVTAPRDGVDSIPLPPPPRDLQQQWTDLDYLLARLEAHMLRTYFGGEALPIFFANLGPDSFSAFLGCPMELLPDTTWVRPIISDWSTRPALRLDANNMWWQLQQEYLRRGRELGRGRWLCGFPDTHTGGDALSAVRGREALCVDLYDHPDEVQQAMLELRTAGREVYAAYFDLAQPELHGSSSGWLGAWGPGRYNVCQCDFMALVSPRVFQRFFDEWLVEEVNWFDGIVWHLDGPKTVPHLDYLLAQPKIKAIQWVPGAGAPPMVEWIPLLKRIQAAGAGLHLGVNAWEVEPLLCELSSRGLMLCTGAASQAEADELIRLAARLTHE